MEIKFKTLIAPLGVQLELTPLCNNRCFHCYNYWRDGKKLTNDALDAKGFIKAIDLMNRAGVFYVTITGGEPLMVKAVWKETLKKLAACNIACDMNSNLVADIEAEDIVLMRDCGLLSILTSFHSYNGRRNDEISGNKGSYCRTLNNIRKLTESGFSISVNMVVTQKNFRDVYKTGKLLHESGIRSFNATRLQDPVREGDLSPFKLSVNEIEWVITQLLELQNAFGLSVGSLTPYPLCFLARDKKMFGFSKRTCNAGITVASLEYSGSLRACPNSEVNYGNIFSDGLEICWQKMQDWREGCYIPNACKDCFYLLICRGGCRATGMRNGEMNAKDELMTDIIKTQIEGLISAPLIPCYCRDDRFVICNKLKYRKENFGYTVVGHKVSSPAFISEKVFRTLLKLKDQKSVSADEFTKEWNVKLSEIHELFSYLEDRKIITRIKKKGGKTDET